MASDIVVYPRMDPKRELKLAQKSFWDGKSSAEYWQKVAADLQVRPDVKFSYASHTGVAEYKEAKAGVTAFGFDVVLGRNIWANDLAASLSNLETLEGIVGKDKLVSTSCFLLHTAVDLVNETKLDKRLAFAGQKVVEVNALARAWAAQKDEVIFSATAAAQASRKSSPRGQRCGGPKLFAISGSPFPEPMVVKITANSCDFKALIDTGSTHNVLKPEVADRMGLKITEDDPIEVCTADGSIMRSQGSCPEFKFEIQGGEFATPAYILPLGGFDVILGMQWLREFGPIKNWDFASLEMELTLGDRTIKIKGIDSEESEAGCSTVEKLLSMVREGVKYGPGVYDIHSPRVPSTEEIADGINKMLAVLETIQVNPDCGLKTRKCTEVKPALKNKLLRSQLVSAT